MADLQECDNYSACQRLTIGRMLKSIISNVTCLASSGRNLKESLKQVSDERGTSKPQVGRRGRTTAR